MCFYLQQSKTATELSNRFNASFPLADKYQPAKFINGFSHPDIPIITNLNQNIINLANWGLIPKWAKDKKIQKSTLNARIETVCEKPSYKNVINQKCLVLTDGFYEWQWLDQKGRKKQKHLICLDNNQPFALAGLWNLWFDQASNIEILNFTIITQEAVGKIANIHSRMPLILSEKTQYQWLESRNLENTPSPYLNYQLIKQ